MHEAMRGYHFAAPPGLSRSGRLRFTNGAHRVIIQADLHLRGLYRALRRADADGRCAGRRGDHPVPSGFVLRLARRLLPVRFSP